jgi:hypothetical protein
MARPKKSGGRVTPKGTGSKKASVPPPSSRYTPPVPIEMKVSPKWIPILMFTLLGLGTLVIFLNYLGLLPGATDNKYLLLGLGGILGGIITATQFH